MAFTIQNWARSTASANEPIVTLASGTIHGCFREYDYYSPVTDSQVTIATASYFDDVAYDLVTGDYINVYSVNDGTRMKYRVTNTSGAITVSLVEGYVVSSTALTAANITGLYATSIQLLAAPGANRMYVFDYAQFTFTYGTAQYTNGGNTTVQYGNTAAGGGTACSAAVANTVIQNIAADSIFTAIPVAVANTAVASAVNLGLFLTNATAAFATGDSTAIVQCGARIVPTA